MAWESASGMDGIIDQSFCQLVVRASPRLELQLPTPDRTGLDLDWPGGKTKDPEPGQHPSIGTTHHWAS